MGTESETSYFLQKRDVDSNAENINTLLAANVSGTEIDLMSIDIDGNDFHVFAAINAVSPRVVVMEYNAKFPPPIRFCMKYNVEHAWKENDCFGASLKFLEVEMGRKGYALVGCNITGANAFFVRKDLVKQKFNKPFSAEQHYEPPRY